MEIAIIVEHTPEGADVPVSEAVLGCADSLQWLRDIHLDTEPGGGGAAAQHLGDQAVSIPELALDVAERSECHFEAKSSLAPTCRVDWSARPVATTAATTPVQTRPAGQPALGGIGTNRCPRNWGWIELHKACYLTGRCRLITDRYREESPAGNTASALRPLRRGGAAGGVVIACP